MRITPPNFDAIPDWLRCINCWILWKAEPVAGKPDKWAKIPKRTDGRGNASSTNPKTWSTFEGARDAYLKAPRGSYSGVGLVLDGQHGIVGIDLDHCIETVRVEDDVLGDHDVRSHSILARKTMLTVPGYWEVSPSGTGLRGFIRSSIGPDEILQKQVSDGDGARECYVTGRYLTVTGDVVEDSSSADWADSVDTRLLNWLDEWMVKADSTSPTVPTRSAGAVAVVTGDGSAEDFSADGQIKGPAEGWDLERVRAEILPHIAVDCGYEDWLEVGAALHHQFGGSEEGFQLWREAFASGGKQAGEEYDRPKWDSFGGAPRPVTLRTLLKKTSEARKAADKAQSAALVQSLVDEVMATVNEDALEALCQDRRVAVAALSALDTVKLRNKVRAQLKSFPSMVGTSSRDLNALVSRFMAPPIPTVRAQQAMPPAFSGWVYVTQGDKFYNIHTRGDAITRMGFNALMNREVPTAVPPAVTRPAADMCTDLWGLTVVERLLYAPGVGDTFTIGDVTYANTYNPASPPEVPEQYSEADLRAIEAVKRHLDLMFPDPREARILLGWLAHNVQFPGRIIGWAPFIPGEMGVGKSFFSQLLRATMGHLNVNEVNVASIATQFKGWASGAAVNILEEVKLHGTNRFEVMNGLKPYITNPAVPMERKGQDPCMVPNFTNYLLMSNFKNGIPIDAGERRYCCLPSALTKADGERLKAQGHYGRLFDHGVHTQAGGLRKWLLEVTIDPEVLTKNAPMTAGRAETIAMGEPEAVEIGRHIIEDGALGVSTVALSAAHFTKELKNRGCLIHGPAVRDTLEALGYHRRVGVSGSPNFKWKGNCVTVYTKNPKLSPDEIRQALDNAKPPSGLDEDVL